MFKIMEFLAVGFIVTAGSVIVLSVETALAEPRAQQYTIPASDVDHYAGYYAPYAILAAAAYYPVVDLQRGENAEKAVDYIFTDKDVEPVTDKKDWPHEQPPTGGDIRKDAKQALESWRYQFGSDATDLCYNDPNNGCNPNGLKHYPGPTFQVWTREDGLLASCSQVGIVFRGTYTDGDWYSNLRVLSKIRLPYVHYLVDADTSYHWLHRNIDAIIRQIQTLGCYQRAQLFFQSRPVIVSLGHSLGGGLAQLAALANKHPANENDTYPPRIEKVFAFEPSPETGVDLVAAKTLKANSAGLEIDRVGHNGDASEYLQYVADASGRGVGRYITAALISKSGNEFYPPSDNRCHNQLLVRQVRFEKFGGSARDLHTWIPIAAQFIAWSKRRAQQWTPLAVEDCETRYPQRLLDMERLQKPLPAAPQVSNLPATQVIELSPPRQLYAPAPTQLAALAHRQVPLAVEYTQAADIGARQPRYARSGLANVNQPLQTAFETSAIAYAGAPRVSNPALRQNQLAVLGQLRASARGAERKQAHNGVAVMSTKARGVRSVATVSGDRSSKNATIASAL